MKNRIRIVLAVLVIASMVLPRVIDLAKFTAADEPFWLAVGANYYYALTHHEFENTVYEYHPAVTTMWIVTGAMLIYFPEYRGLMNGYFQQEKTSFDSYLVEHGRDPLELLWWARLLQTLLNVSLFVIAFFLLRYLLDEWVALAVLLLTSFAPYLFGQSRMLNHESMVGLFSLIAVLGMCAYLFRDALPSGDDATPITVRAVAGRGTLVPNGSAGRQPGLLILSAAAAAFANLTKSSSIVLLPVIAVIIFVWAVTLWKDQKWSMVGSALKIFLAWLGILILVYVISWPGMWVAPGKMLYEVYGNAFSYAFQGARLSVTQGLQPSNFSLNSAVSGVITFLISIAWRTTPVTWLGLIFAMILLFHRDEGLAPGLAKLLIAFLLLESFACIGLFAVARGRDQPHYVLAAYYGFEFSAALGWVYALRWLARSFDWARKPPTQVIMFAVILILQAAGLFYTTPYYYTYLNPLMLATNPAPGFLYGEKMEEAAAYLAEKPDPGNQTALVYFGRSFSYYYPGKTLLFKPVLFEDKTQLIENLRQADYLVMYSGLHERLPLLKKLTPEHIIYLNGRQYVEIYRVLDIPASFYGE